MKSMRNGEIDLCNTWRHAPHKVTCVFPGSFWPACTVSIGILRFSASLEKHERDQVASGLNQSCIKLFEIHGHCVAVLCLAFTCL